MFSVSGLPQDAVAAGAQDFRPLVDSLPFAVRKRVLSHERVTVGKGSRELRHVIFITRININVYLCKYHRISFPHTHTRTCIDLSVSRRNCAHYESYDLRKFPRVVFVARSLRRNVFCYSSRIALSSLSEYRSFTFRCRITFVSVINNFDRYDPVARDDATTLRITRRDRNLRNRGTQRFFSSRDLFSARVFAFSRFRDTSRYFRSRYAGIFLPLSRVTFRIRWIKLWYSLGRVVVVSAGVILLRSISR